MKDVQKQRIGFLFLGGAHQVLHSAPVAAELGKTDVDVTCFVAERGEAAVIEGLLASYPGSNIRTEPLPAPAWAKLLGAIWRPARSGKVPRLLANLRALRRCSALVTAERTSTVLKRLHLYPGALIHIPHGAGDRAKGFEPRLRLFDLVIVAGRKDAERMIAEKVVKPDRCAVGGPVKLGTIARLGSSPTSLFNDDRPTILYNPHFDNRLGSWEKWGTAVVRSLASQSDFNLIVAPHVRLFENAGADRIAAFKSLAETRNILIDPGSLRSSNMTYTLAADIYLGDVSSQVYEFISHPRPCVFLNAHGVDWRGDPNYACWAFGDVVDRLEDLLPALSRAHDRFAAHYRDVQVNAARAALGTDWEDAPARSARIILNFLEDGRVEDDYGLNLTREP